MLGLIIIVGIVVYVGVYMVQPYNVSTEGINPVYDERYVTLDTVEDYNSTSTSPNFNENSSVIVSSIDNETDNRTKSFHNTIDLQGYKDRAIARYEQRLMDDTVLTGVFVGWFCTEGNDHLAPETDMIVSGLEGLHGWYISDVKIKPNATDICTGVKRTIVRDLTRPAFQWELTPSSYEYQNGIVLKSKLDLSHPRGTKIIEYFSIDNSHNIEREKQLRVRLDYQDPYLTIMNQSSTVIMKSEGRYNMQIHASDYHSGIDYITVDPCAGQFFFKTCKPLYFNNTHDNTYTMKPSMYINYTQYLKKGIYDYTITAVDYAGHFTQQKVLVFVATAIPKPR
jgi:hypothetical protein